MNPESPGNTEKRIVKVPLPVAQIRRMDELLSVRSGGFETRAEFIHEAIENLILELTFEEEPAPPSSPLELRNQVKVGVSADASDSGEGIEATALEPPSPGFVHEGAFELGDKGLLFGLHNRDYPSLWGLAQLASLTEHAPIPFDEFLDETVSRAWQHGQILQRLETLGWEKLSILFPTNSDKPISAADRFRLFALGDFQERDGRIVTFGPLFAWRVAGLFETDRGLVLAPTPAGTRLLSSLSGLSAAWPHEPAHAEIFLAHLRHEAPGDYAGFEAVLKAIESGASRDDLLEAFSRRWPELGDSEVSVNMQAYVARCREWGLVEPKQVRRRYALTEFGIQYVSELIGGENDE